MVPLPYEGQFVGVELIAVPDIILAVRREIHLHGLQRDGVVAHYRPAVHPGHGLHGRDASHAAVVLEHDGIPVSGRGVNDCTLGDAVGSASKGTGKHDLALVLAQKLLAAPAGLGPDAAGRPVDFEHIIVVTYMIYVCTFCPEYVAFAWGAEQQGVHSPFLDGTGIRFKLGDAQVAVAPDHEKPSVVEEH